MHRRHRTDIWSYLLITAVTVLIWYWSASETREERTLPLRIEFRVADAAEWLIQPDTITVSIAAEGSRRAIANAQQISRITVDVPATIGTSSVDVADLVREHAQIEETGISVQSVDPDFIELDLDEMIDVPARVALERIPGVQTQDRPEIDPPEVTVSLPAGLLAGGTRTISLQPVISAGAVEALEPGVRHTLEEVPLRAPNWLTEAGPLRVTPAEVRVSFTIRSQIVDVMPPVPVRVQLAGSPEDEYLVELEPKLLRDVTVTVPTDLGQQIEAGDVKVFAIVYLKMSEKEASLDRKPVTFFIAMRPDGTAEIVTARVAGSTGPPEIELKITERAAE
ncbi:MAG: hypothetical protein GY715_06900 [Planctomycetes bacterium]|nr:hypothetical protein [Planctomycetota bacterium]